MPSASGRDPKVLERVTRNHLLQRVTLPDRARTNVFCAARLDILLASVPSTRRSFDPRKGRFNSLPYLLRLRRRRSRGCLSVARVSLDPNATSVNDWAMKLKIAGLSLKLFQRLRAFARCLLLATQVGFVLFNQSPSFLSSSTWTMSRPEAWCY